MIEARVDQIEWAGLRPLSTIAWCGTCIGARPTEVAAGGAFVADCFGERDAAWLDAGGVTGPVHPSVLWRCSSPVSLPFVCSEKRVHSGLYDGLTVPDTGCASID